MAQSWADTLQGAGAWLSGQGPQYMLARESQQRTQLADERAQHQYEADMRRERMMATVQDTARLANLYAMGDLDGVTGLLQQRLSALQESGGDPSHTQALLQAHQQDPRAAARDVMSGYQTFQAMGLLRPMEREVGPKRIGVEGSQVLYEGPDGPYAVPIEGYQQPRPSERESLELEKIRAEIARINKEVNGLPPDDREAAKAERKETLKANVERIATLSEGVKSRSSDVAKAQKFLDAFKSKEKSSGAGVAFADWIIPGTWTSQGQFNEELDSFSEVAARAKLKANGEVRPTDADVEGMKRAIFGKGRDEKTNIALLEAFISEQRALDEELAGLRKAKDAGELSSYTGLTAGMSGGAEDGQPQTIASQAEFDALPSGAVYIDSEDGKKYRKP